MQFNPLLEKNELKQEESHSLKYLEKLGISKEHLIFSNLKDNNDLQYQNNAALMNNLIAYKNGTYNSLNNQFANISQNKYFNSTLTNEIKQYINGTYRIAFHLVQKKMLKELNSEQMQSNRSSAYSKINHLDSFNEISTSSEPSNTLSNINRQNNRLSANEKKPAIVVNKADDHDSDNENTISSDYGKYGKQNSNSNNSNTNTNNNNSIFVRLNSNNNQPSPIQKSLSVPNGTNSEMQNGNPYQFTRINSSYTKNETNNKSNNSNQQQEQAQQQQPIKRIMSKEKTNLNSNNHTANSRSPQPTKQSSKFCLIL